MKSGRLNLKKLLRSDLVHIPPILALYPFVHEVFSAGASVKQHVYHSEVVSLSAFSDPEFPICLLLLIAPPLLFRSRLNWQEFDRSGAARLAAGLLALLGAWAFAMADYNHYYNYWHTADRLALGILALLVFVHPLFLAPAALWILLSAHQLDYPIGIAETTDKRLLFQLLILTYTCVLTKIVLPVRGRLILLLLSALVAANYFFAGWEKLILGPDGTEWLLHNDLANLAAAARANGWLAWRSEAQTIQMLHRLQRWNLLLTSGALFIELGSLFWWAGRRVFVVGALLHIGFHCAIAAVSGVFFWKWIAVNLILIAAVSTARREEQIFSLDHFAAFVVITACSGYYFNPVRLGWFDTPLSNFYKLYAVTASGEEFEIPNNFFGPYDIFFQQSKFYYLGGDALVGTYGGAKNHQFAAALAASRTAADIEDLRHRFGGQPRDDERCAKFRSFVRQFVLNVLAQGRREPRWWSSLRLLRPPYHIYSQTRDKPFDGSQRASAVSVRFNEVLYTGESLLQTKNAEVLRIELFGDSAAGAAAQQPLANEDLAK